MKSNSIYLPIIVGLVVVFMGLGFTSIYAQEEEASTVEVGMSILTTVVGMIILLIPIIRRELIASKYQNPAIIGGLDRIEKLSQDYINNSESLEELAEIIYAGLPKEYVDKIEGKPKAKLVELEKNVLRAKTDYERALQLYQDIREKL